MSIANVTEQRILALIFLAESWSRYADDASVTPETAIAVSLQVSAVPDAGNMSSNETQYPGYGRVNRPRTPQGPLRPPSPP